MSAEKTPEAANGDGGAADMATCPWCSASVPTSATQCHSCGAALRDAVDGDVLGVTQIDPSAVSRAARIKPGRLATWLGAESTAEETDLGGKIEPPSPAVREEMLRLELAAIDAEIEAKATRAAAERELPPDGEEPGPDARGAIGTDLDGIAADGTTVDAPAAGEPTDEAVDGQATGVQHDIDATTSDESEARSA